MGKEGVRKRIDDCKGKAKGGEQVRRNENGKKAEGAEMDVEADRVS